MNKKIAFTYEGQKEQVGFMPVIRSLPNRYVETVGHFVFLDQLPLMSYPTSELTKTLEEIKGTTAHPHRGIATFSYVMKGTIEHNDSAGNYGIVKDGGIQWMNAGSGIIHDEIIIPSNNETTEQFGMQLWINLPSKQKVNAPEYMAIQSEEVPEIDLPDQIGKLRILIGEKEGLKSNIPTYSRLFLFHLVLNGGQSFELKIESQDQSAVVVTRGEALVNGQQASQGELLVFENEAGSISVENVTDEAVDVLIFGGEPYTEPIVFGGPFVMNTQQQISQANQDYHMGKYGEITYKN